VPSDHVFDKSSTMRSKRARSVNRNFGVGALGRSPEGILQVITLVRRSREVAGVLTLHDDKSILKAVVTTTLSSSSDMGVQVRVV
jgi:hypothetical protein